MKYYQIIFSPTGGTEKVAKAMTRSWPQSSSAIHFFMCFSSFCHAARLRGRFMMRVALLYLTLPPDFQATDAIWGGGPNGNFRSPFSACSQSTGGKRSPCARQSEIAPRHSALTPFPVGQALNPPAARTRARREASRAA